MSMLGFGRLFLTSGKPIVNALKPVGTRCLHRGFETTPPRRFIPFWQEMTMFSGMMAIAWSYPLYVSWIYVKHYKQPSKIIKINEKFDGIIPKFSRPHQERRRNYWPWKDFGPLKKQFEW